VLAGQVSGFGTLRQYLILVLRDHDLASGGKMQPF
jgi:hypothetical protein